MSLKTQDCLTKLIRKWDPPFAVKVEGKLQYVLTAPLLADKVTHVSVTFKNGVATAKVGAHTNPDVTISMTGEDFVKSSSDDLDLLRAVASKQASISKHTPMGQRLLKHLGASYRNRP